jgi:hypothetical protein
MEEEERRDPSTAVVLRWRHAQSSLWMTGRETQDDRIERSQGEADGSPTQVERMTLRYRIPFVRVAWCLCLLAGCGSLAVPQVAELMADDAREQDPSDNPSLTIIPESLQHTFLHVPYMVKFSGRGSYVPVLRWRVESGTLPPGITLDDDGTLHGQAQKAGEFQFVVSVRDGGKPQQAVQRGYIIKVQDAMTLDWKVPAHVAGNRIEGSVEVSNATAEEMDLTFDVKAVSENGRATEIGYQHFPLKGGTLAMELPFGETLPYGAYFVNVNLVGEVASRNTIYRQQMQTSKRLRVTVGP